MRLVVAGGIVVGVLASAAIAVGSPGDGEGGLEGRSFTVTAAAFPIDPAPGTNQTSFGVRPVSVRAQRSAPPGESYARSAVADPGTAELYTGPPPEGSFAECDTGLENQPAEEVVEAGTVRMAVSCRDPARVTATATGASSGEQRTLHAEVLILHGRERLVATAVAEVAGLEVGPLRFGSARYVGSVSTDGRTGEARGVIEVGQATVAGIPVRLASDGIAVDRTKVPVEMLAAATDAVHKALSATGYLGARVVQPATEVAGDGSHVAVVGGGVELLAATNDPTNNYYVSLTLLGGELRIDLGGVSGTESMQQVGNQPGTTRRPSESAATVRDAAVVTDASVPTTAARPGSREATVALAGSDRAPGSWPGLWWLVAAAGLLPVGLLVASWRFPKVRESLAERYLRG